MDRKTIEHYDTKADELTVRYDAVDLTAVRLLLKRWLPREGRVLEVGCGSGLDSEYMASTLGLEVVATDASEKMIARAAANPSRKKITFRHAAFPLPGEHELLGEKFDAVVAIAVLMHIPDHELFDFAYQVRTVLKTKGVFVCSFCSGRETTSDDSRLFIHREPGEVQLLFERMGFNLVAREENADFLKRGITWTSLVFSYDDRFGARPVDQIESIINRDSKTATYKMALLRALCDIAQKSFHHVKWHPGDRVSVPLGLIVEKWLYYYWPLVESNLDLPEMRVGIRAKGLAFRGVLTQLIETFKPGGLSLFFTLFHSGRLTEEQAVLLSRVATQIAQTIVKGPISYSGGSLDLETPFFTYEGSKTLKHCRLPSDMVNGFGRVFFAASIWRELCLVGHWIGEAILLRWAHLSRSFCKMNVEVADILAQLLIIPTAERATGDVKGVYAQESELICVWSDKKIPAARFDVDHAIPFSLWQNNDLWNLFPADPKVNNQKRDKIVTRDTLHRRRDCLIYYWQLLCKASPVRFKSELRSTLLGSKFDEKNWENSAFSTLSETLETVARQRGVQRWAPE